MKFRILFVVFALIWLPVLANAQIIYEQSALETTDRGAYQYVDQQLADDFVPTISATLGTIIWRGSYYGTDNPSSTESFTIQLFTDNAGLPSNTPLFEVVGLASKVDVGTHLGKTLYEYSLSVTGPVLNTGTTYWINIYTNDSPSNYAGANSTDGSADGALKSGLGAWVNFDNNGRSNHIFRLEGGGAATTVSGTITYTGAGTGQISVAAFDGDGCGDGFVTEVWIPGPGPYTLNLSPGTYYICACRDTNNNGSCPDDPSEPANGFDGNPVTVSAEPVTGINISLQGQPQRVTSVPTITEWGMIIFMVLAGLGSVYYLKRQRRA